MAALNGTLQTIAGTASVIAGGMSSLAAELERHTHERFPVNERPAIVLRRP